MSEEHTTRKCYMADTGLLVIHSFRDDIFTDNELYRDVLLDRLHMNGDAHGEYRSIFSETNGG